MSHFLSEKAFKYYSMVDVLFSNLQFFVLNINQHLFLCVLNPGLLFTNIFSKLYMARTASLSIFISWPNMRLSPKTQSNEKHLAMIFKVKTSITTCQEVDRATFQT